MSDDEPDNRCPKCSCALSDVVGLTMAFGKAVQRRRCNFCSHIFRGTAATVKDQPMQAAKAAAFDHDPSAPVAYHSEAVRCTCPFCQAKNPPVTRTLPEHDGIIVRYHKCTSCSRTFPSQEA